MVFTSIVSLVRSRGPDEFWRKRRIFKLSAHYLNRPRNCYSLAVRQVHRALVFATKGREQRRLDRRLLWDTRTTAAAREHGLCTVGAFREGLDRGGVLVDRRALADLAAFEPRTFGALCATSATALQQPQPYRGSPPGVFERFRFFLKGS